MLLDPTQALVHYHDQNSVCHLTETELRQLHRRFGHPSAQRLRRVLDRAGHEPNANVIEKITKFYKEC